MNQTEEKTMFKNAGRVKRTIEEYFVLTVATLILVVGVYVFKFPNNFSFRWSDWYCGRFERHYADNPLEISHLLSIWHCLCWDLFFLEKVLESRRSMSVC